MRFEVGQKVIVSDVGKLYTTYDDWVYKNERYYLRRYILDSEKIDFFNETSILDRTYTVVKGAPHESHKDYLYLIKAQDNERLLLIVERGLEPVKKEVTFKVTEEQLEKIKEIIKEWLHDTKQRNAQWA